jgi:RHH-type proline utilization regulon transcriptional repressor/proline dehydrogenase/delta 1-pyrroline-5-carboxylate dehydrogenase
MKDMSDRIRTARQAIRPLYRASEREVLAPLAEAARLTIEDEHDVRASALNLVAELRSPRRLNWINRFLQEYALGTDEGLALLGLAEAFLRVPDAFTATELIHDKVGDVDWKAHLGASPSARVNAATFGLIMTQAVSAEGEAGPLRRAAAKLGEPAIRIATGRAMQMLGEQFVLGRTIEEGLKRGREYPGFRFSFDMLGEGARTAADAERYFQAYVDGLKAVGRCADREEEILGRDAVSVKLSALHPRYEPLQADRAVPFLSGRLIELCRIAKDAGVGLTVDAEEADRLEMSLDIIAAAAADPSLKDWDALGMAVQAYQRRARAVVDWADALGEATGRQMAVRLVKGAYWDTEIKRAQEAGMTDYPVFTRKAATDVSYLACAKAMLRAPNIYPAFATHNALTVATVMHWADGSGDFEFQRLHGMGEGLYEDLIAAQGVRARIYAPIGGYRDLLAYLVRRLLENGANSSFVNLLADADVKDEDLIADPVRKVESVGFAPHPRIPNPLDIYPDRKNSRGVDLSDPETVAAIGRAMGQVWTKPSSDGEHEVRAPAQADAVVGRVHEAGPGEVDQAMVRALNAQPAWSARDPADRAACLDRAADLMERDRDRLMALAVREAGKTWADAVGEVREAVDFCRYYAGQARTVLERIPLPGPTGETNALRFAGRGVFACISPWNFPLAIFTGQVTAALVTGNAVLAKPAPQTPLIAAHAVGLLHEAGVPADVLQLLSGGPAVGEAIVAHPKTAGVAFTGSTATARRIAGALLAEEGRPIVPLIAETGGLNAMIVDSTALPEQVVQDVITSAFRSAGQRCSALRLLCLQQEVAEPMLEMLKGAMAELVIGDPVDPAVDVGPVIDEQARDRLLAHIDKNQERVIAQCALPPAAAEGWFAPPTMIRLDAVEDLKEEVFGPILHVVGWEGGELERLVERINSTGYGLTLGLHSRLAEAAQRVAAVARVGNLYVNRSMIGAVVGVQPFGGEGLSGTGPKAGGPHYLPRFCVERTLTVDVTSAGGNARLLSLED